MARYTDDLFRMTQEIHDQERRRRLMGIDDETLRGVREHSRLLDSVGFRLQPEESFLAKIAALGRPEHSAVFDMAKSANHSALNILDELRPRISAVEQIHAISQGWRKELDAFRHLHANPNATMESALGSHLTRVAEVSLLAQGKLARFRWQDVGRTFGVPDSVRAVVGERFIEFSDSYSRLFTSFEQPRTSVLTLPPALSELPAVEFFNGVDLLEVAAPAGEEEDEFEEDRRVVRAEIAEETNDGLCARLVSLDPELLRLGGGSTSFALNKP